MDSGHYGGTQRPPPQKLTPLFPREFTGRWPLCTTVGHHTDEISDFETDNSHCCMQGDLYNCPLHCIVAYMYICGGPKSDTFLIFEFPLLLDALHLQFLFTSVSNDVVLRLPM